jgi:hypothetical protein
LKKEFFTENEELKPFFDEINKYSEGVHNLNSGVDLKDIENLENDLGIKLPDLYKEFLMVCNGGELFVPGTVLSEVYIPSSGQKKIGVSYLNDAFKDERKWPGMPKDYLIIANLNYGDLICIDLTTNDGIDADIVQWSHEEGVVSRRWSGIAEWLMDVLQEGALLVDYDGNEKDLNF